MSAKRRIVSHGALFRMLAGAFAQRRPGECASCTVPLPYLIDRPDAVSANWRIGTPRNCEHGCQAILMEIAAELWPLYDVFDDRQRADKAP